MIYTYMCPENLESICTTVAPTGNVSCQIAIYNLTPSPKQVGKERLILPDTE